ncbi:hypothetical protein D3C86_2014550 [compost metagenome]
MNVVSLTRSWLIDFIPRLVAISSTFGSPALVSAQSQAELLAFVRKLSGDLSQ